MVGISMGAWQATRHNPELGIMPQVMDTRPSALVVGDVAFLQ